MTPSFSYEDILHAARPPVPQEHPPMPLLDRAAQFAPFAALSGYDDAITEAGRLTQTCRELTEDALEELNRSLMRLLQDPTRPKVELLCFCRDEYKSGGAYTTVCGRIRRIDHAAGLLHLDSGKVFRCIRSWIAGKQKKYHRQPHYGIQKAPERVLFVAQRKRFELLMTFPPYTISSRAP